MAGGSESRISLMRGLSRPFWALLVLSVVCLTLMFGFLTKKLNENSIHASERVLESVFADRKERLSVIGLEYAYWDEAVNNLVDRVDMSWIESTIAYYLFEDLGLHGFFVVGPKGEKVVSLVEDEFLEEDPVALYGQAAKDLISAARGSPENEQPVPVTGFLFLNNELHMATAVRMTTYTDTEDISTDSVMVLVQDYGADALAEMGQRFLMPNMRITEGEATQWQASLTVPSFGGAAVQRIIWDPPLPGFQILPYVSVALFIVFVAMLITASFFVRRASKVVEEIDYARRKADEANATKSNFLAATSHDLRTPLNAIMGFSDLMKQETFGPLGDSRYADYMRDINYSGSVLVSLVDDILDISKIEAGKYELLDEPIDVHAAIQTNIRQVSKLAERSKIAIEFDSADQVPDLLADRNVISRILNNLLSNAIKFTPQGGCVAVSAMRRDDGGIGINITDTGAGMTPGEVEVALKPFEQPRHHETSAAHGTGLGLFLSKNFMELHGGYLKIDSKPSIGTQVFLGFPPERTQI